jgi:uncharacterized protein (TIGR03437 family)
MSISRAALVLSVSVVTSFAATGGVITTVAGDGAIELPFVTVNGGLAVSAALLGPCCVVVDFSGNLFFVDAFNQVRMLSTSGMLTTVAGNGIWNVLGGFSGDGGPATSAELGDPQGLAVDSSGNLFIADTLNNRVRKVSSGVITTVAGSGAVGPFALGGGYSGDGGPATSGLLNQPTAVAADALGNLFIADTQNHVIRKVSPTGIITTFAGNGESFGENGDGGPATSAVLGFPTGVVLDAFGNLFIGDSGDSFIRKVSTSGIITTVEGVSNTSPNCACFTLDTFGNLFIASPPIVSPPSIFDGVQEVSPGGIVTTIAGNGTIGFSGDGGPAIAAELNDPQSVAVDASGNLFIADLLNNRIRMVSPLTTWPAPLVPSGSIAPVDSTVTTIQPGEWVSIYGSNLADAAGPWQGNFPTSLGGTSVTINGKSAYISYVSPGQINVQTPNDTATGAVPVVVTTHWGSATATVTLAQFGPSFFLLADNHVAGIILRSNGSGAYGGGAYDLLGPTGTLLGYSTVAAKAGDIVALFCTGFGPTNPNVPAGQVFTGAAETTYAVSVEINHVIVTPTFAGLSGAGVYQINLTVPPNLGAGDVSLVATVGGDLTPSNVLISLQ